jgi:hypothetical protein
LGLLIWLLTSKFADALVVDRVDKPGTPKVPKQTLTLLARTGQPDPMIAAYPDVNAAEFISREPTPRFTVGAILRMEGALIVGVRLIYIHATREDLSVLEDKAKMFEPESVLEPTVKGAPDTLPDHLLTGSHVTLSYS